MRTSTTHSNDSRSLFTRFGKIATALAFGGLLCTFPVGSAWAARHHGGGGHRAYHGGGYHGGWRGHYWGWGPNYYYTPGPDYYVAPEPYAYYPPEPGYYYPEPSEGLNLFFHL
ncbi:MAG: hypothetical protein WCA22_20485 [Candidatus Binatus sp.]